MKLAFDSWEVAMRSEAAGAFKRVFMWPLLDHLTPDRSGTAHRRLNDGREFRIIKVFYEPAILERQLIEMGWQGWVRSSRNFFVYGNMTPV